MRAVLIDLDDTLFDHTASSRLALRTLCQADPALAARPFAGLMADHAAILEEVHLEVLRGALGLEAARIERFRRLFARHACPTDPAAAAAGYRAAYQQARQAVPGAMALLEQLRDRAAIAIVSNNLQAEQEEKLRHLGMAHLIDALVVSETAGVAKPDPAIFATALRQLGCAADDAVMLGDSWAADVLGARAAGLRAVWLNRHGHLSPDPSFAHELVSLEPTADVLALLLGESA
jgi:putative hydrolase of the HAD superfamily